MTLRQYPSRRSPKPQVRDARPGAAPSASATTRAGLRPPDPMASSITPVADRPPPGPPDTPRGARPWVIGGSRWSAMIVPGRPRRRPRSRPGRPRCRASHQGVPPWSRGLPATTCTTCTTTSSPCGNRGPRPSPAVPSMIPWPRRSHRLGHCDRCSSTVPATSPAERSSSVEPQSTPHNRPEPAFGHAHVRTHLAAAGRSAPSGSATALRLSKVSIRYIPWSSPRPCWRFARPRN